MISLDVEESYKKLVNCCDSFVKTLARNCNITEEDARKIIIEALKKDEQNKSFVQ